MARYERDFGNDAGRQAWHGTGGFGHRRGMERGFAPGAGAYDEAYGGGYRAFGPGGGMLRDETAERGFAPDRGRDTFGWTRTRDAQGGLGASNRIRAAEIMTANPEAVTPEATVAEVARLMKELDVGVIPVVDGDETLRLRGVVTDRDLVTRALANGGGGDTRIAECMTGQVETVNKNDSVRRVFDVMKRAQVRRVPVTDRDGRLVGIISQADLALEYAGMNLNREAEVEEVLERISEPPRWRGQ
jgi:CBS domain-containing protein